MMSRRKRDEKLELDSGIDTVEKKECFFLLYFQKVVSFSCTQRKGEECQDLSRVSLQIYTRVRIYSPVWAHISGYNYQKAVTL